MAREALGLSLYDIRLRQAGIPIGSGYNISTPINDISAKFVLQNKNTVIIGDNHYNYAIKLMRLSVAHNYTYAHKMCSMAEIDRILFSVSDFIFEGDILCIHSISGENKMVNAVISNLLTSHKTVLLSSRSVDDIHNSLADIWESVDSNFEVMKV